MYIDDKHTGPMSTKARGDGGREAAKNSSRQNTPGWSLKMRRVRHPQGVTSGEERE